MSIKIMSTVWEHARVQGSELLVLLAMADYGDDDGTNIYPSMETLAKKARISEDQTRRIIKKLRQKGLVRLVRAGGWRDGKNWANDYAIVVAKITGMSLQDATSLQDARSPRRRKDSPRAGATTVPAPVQPQPPLHPPLESPGEPIGATAPRPPAVDVFREVHHRFPKKSQFPKFESIADLDQWRTVCETWRDRGYNPTNIAGQLEWYADPSKMERYINGHHAPISKVQQSMNAVDEYRALAEKHGATFHD